MILNNEYLYNVINQVTFQGVEYFITGHMLAHYGINQHSIAQSLFHNQLFTNVHKVWSYGFHCAHMTMNFTSDFSIMSCHCEVFPYNVDLNKIL